MDGLSLTREFPKTKPVSPPIDVLATSGGYHFVLKTTLSPRVSLANAPTGELSAILSAVIV